MVLQYTKRAKHVVCQIVRDTLRFSFSRDVRHLIWYALH